MAIISFDKDTPIEYIPEYGGNRNSDDPCVVTLKFVPYSKVQVYSKLIAEKSRKINDSSKTSEVVREVQKKQFVDSVEKVSGFFVSSKEVIDAGEFYDCADTELIIEILKAMESASKLSEGQRKN